jgi:hypothetical protein
MDYQGMLQRAIGAPAAMDKEKKFLDWIQKTPWYPEFIAKYGEQPDLNTPRYDYRKAFESGVTPQVNKYDNTYHWPSAAPDGTMLKSPDHPTSWMEYFMRNTGVDPQSLGLTTKEEGDAWINQQRGRR